MTMITPSYLGETIEYSSLHACRSTLEDPTAAGQKPAVSGGVEASLVSSDPSPSGGQVVTYNGWPLYLYVADPTAGTAHGQALSSNGGLWYVISLHGQVIKKHAGAASSSKGNGY